MNTETPPLGFAKFSQRLAAFFYDLILYVAAFMAVGLVSLIFIINDLPGPKLATQDFAEDKFQIRKLPGAKYLIREDAKSDDQKKSPNKESSRILPEPAPNTKPPRLKKYHSLGWFHRTNPIYLFAQWIILPIAYFGWFWTRGGQTLSMRSWKIRIEQLNGCNITWWQTFLRLSPLLLTIVICYWLKLNTFIALIAVGAICMSWSLFSKKGQGINDIIAGTRVVRVEKGYVPPKNAE